MGKGIVQDAFENGERSWCKAYFRITPKCDIVDNNMAESFNGWILHIRTKLVITMLEEIRVIVMNRIREKRDFASRWNGGLGPRIVKVLKDNIIESFE